MDDNLHQVLPRTVKVLLEGVAEGLHPGVQLYVSLRGEVVADVALGEARAGVPMTTGTLTLWMSSTKPITAVAVAQLWEQGKLDLDDPVARHIPEFAANGKEAVTIRHVLTHTGGFRGLIGRWEERPWDQVIEAVCVARLEPGWVPGRKAGYHLHTGWYILAELVARLSGVPFDRYGRERIFLPLGMNDSWIGLPPELYRAYDDRIAWTHDTSGPEPKAPHALDSEAGAASVRPGSNGRGPIRQLGMFYEMMLGKGRRGDVRILSPQTAEALVAGHRIGMHDQTFRHVIDWGLGFIRNSNRYGVDTVPYGFGPHASDRTFGHSGAQSSTGFCDPEHGLVVAWACNGMPGEKHHDERLRAIDAAIYEDLGLVSS